MSLHVTERIIDAPSGGTGGSIAELPRRKLRYISVSDQHLSEGRTIMEEERLAALERLRRKARGQEIGAIQVENPLEDFPHDEEFAALMARLGDESAQYARTTLVLNGDNFDFLAVRWNGRFKASEIEYEYEGVEKMRVILEGHPAYFDALAAFLLLPNTETVILPGNHDQQLIWPEVQRLLAWRIAGHDPARRARVIFVDEDEHEPGAFRFVRDGLLFEHGNNADPINAFPPKCIRQPRFGRGKGLPYMELNFGARWAEAVNQMKLRNEKIGRNHYAEGSHVWAHALLYSWGWCRTAAYWFLVTVFRLVLPFWTEGWLRRIRLVSTVLISTIWEDKGATDRWLARIRQTRLDVKVIVHGHTHAASRRTVVVEDGSKRTVTDINTGTWIRMIRMTWPIFRRTWTSFRWLEVAVRAFQHFLKTGKISYARKTIRVIWMITVATALILFVIANFPGEHYVLFWDIEPNDFRWPIGILLVFALVSAIISIFAVKPEEESFRKLTFADVSYDVVETAAEDGTAAHSIDALRADCMEWRPEDSTVRECV